MRVFEQRATKDDGPENPLIAIATDLLGSLLFRQTCGVSSEILEQVTESED